MYTFSLQNNYQVMFAKPRMWRRAKFCIPTHVTLLMAKVHSVKGDIVQDSAWSNIREMNMIAWSKVTFPLQWFNSRCCSEAMLNFKNPQTVWMKKYSVYSATLIRFLTRFSSWDSEMSHAWAVFREHKKSIDKINKEKWNSFCLTYRLSRDILLISICITKQS